MNTVILDGGMGQELVKRSFRPVTPLWSTEVLLHEPEIVTDLHAAYIAAGADVITLASYSATPERLERDHIADSFLSLQSAATECAERAREQAGREGVKIAASLPPLVASYHTDLAPATAQALASYRRIVEAQATRCDLMLCETMGSIAEAHHAATAALESGLPVWVAFTVDDKAAVDDPRLRSGESVCDAVEQIGALGVDALMVNCSRPEACGAALQVMQSSPLKTGVYANAFKCASDLKAGGTVDGLAARNDLGPEAYADFAADWQAMGASIIGGCCETGPEHIEVLRQRMHALA